MTSLMTLVLPLCTLAHVQVHYNGTLQRPVRNARSATSNGQMSVAGPCGGADTWGAQGYYDITAGTEMFVKIAYNGGHKAATNEFHAVWKCTTNGPTEDELEIPFALDAANILTLKDGTMPAPKTGKPNFVDASQGNSGPGANGYTLNFDLPAEAEGRCTVSLMDASRGQGREWGGCVDLMVTQPPPPAAPGVPTDPPTMMPTSRPITITDVLGRFMNVSVSCISNLDGCCCIDANYTVVRGGPLYPSDHIRATLQTHGCPKLATPHVSDDYRIDIMRETDFSFMAMRTIRFPAAGGQLYRITITDGLVSLVNVGEDAPKTCDADAYILTEEAQTLLTLVEAVRAEVRALEAMIEEYQADGSVSSAEASMLQDKITSLDSLYMDYWAAYNASGDSQVFAGNTTQVEGMYTDAVSDATTLASTASSGGSSGSDSGKTAAIVIVVLLLIAAIAVGIVYRERIMDAVNKRRAPQPKPYADMDREAYVSMEKGVPRPPAVVNESYHPQRAPPPARPAAPSRPAPPSRPTPPSRPAAAARPVVAPRPTVRGPPPPRPMGGSSAI